MTERPRVSPRRRRADVGSVLLLMPAALLLVVGLGAIAIDATLTFQAQREAVGDAQSIAHDLASALSANDLRRGADVSDAAIDTDLAKKRIAAIVAIRSRQGRVTWRVRGATVEVTVRREVRLVFSGAMPGIASSRTVQGRGTAALVHQEIP